MWKYSLFIDATKKYREDENQLEKAEKAAKEATEKAFIEYVDKILKSFHISPQEACQKLDESYERYLEIKKTL